MDTVPAKIIEKQIYTIRGEKVMFDFDLADLYDVETKSLKRAVRRNIKRFPADFMFELSKQELENWRCQFGTSNREKMGMRVTPFAFTEQGIAMLSGVLNSDRAIHVNIEIMRVFIKHRKLLACDDSLFDKIGKLEKGTNQLFRVVFERLDQLEAELPILPP